MSESYARRYVLVRTRMRKRRLPARDKKLPWSNAHNPRYVKFGSTALIVARDKAHVRVGRGKMERRYSSPGSTQRSVPIPGCGLNTRGSAT